MNKILSIIIPYYNTLPYITELLDGLASQITDEIEVIVIDDGSSIPFQTEYQWVKTIRQANGGASAARNTGLDNAEGEYIAFIDSDDLVSQNYIAAITNKIKNEHFDYCYLSWNAFGGWDYQVTLKTINDHFPQFNLCVWNRIYRKDMIGNVRFNTIKLIAEDAEFIRDVKEEGRKKAFISEIIYHYRSNTPNSLTKRFNNGELNTQRVIYYYNHITQNMTWLIDEVKKLDQSAEVIICTNQNDLPELTNYAMVIPPRPLKGTELRGEYTKLFTKLSIPFRTQIVIYTDKTFAIGGIETFIYNFCMNFKDKYDITVLYNTMDTEQIKRLNPYVHVKKNDLSKQIECDTLIINRITDEAPANIKYKKRIQMIHSCRFDEHWHVPQNKDIDVIVPVSQPVKDSFSEDLIDKNVKVINNLTYSKEENKRALRLLSATRLTYEKGESRMIRLAEILNENKIPFIWTIFSERHLKQDIPGIVYMKPTLNIKDYMIGNDYIVQLSDSEAFCYTIVEALELGIPVLTTPIEPLNVLGFEEGKTGYILPFDMRNVDIQKIYSCIPSVNYKYDNTRNINEWDNVLDIKTQKSEYQQNTNDTSICQIRAIKSYYDMYFQRNVYQGEILTVPQERAKAVVDFGTAIYF